MGSRYKATLFATVAGVLTLPALAQNPSQGAAAEDQLQEVTVTGSRIIVNGDDAPTPVTVVSLDEMSATKPTTVYEQLKDLPVFAGSGGATGIPTRGVNAGANTGASSLDLRGLGAIRALVLFDGHRVPSSTPDGQVDINLMPQMLMQRVDVVTGGASAVYGSDAVTGVVNFIIDRKFNGVKFDAQGGESSRHDDGSYNIGVAAGTDLFDGRGHVEGSFQVNGDQGLPTYLTRPSIFDWLLVGSGTAADPYHPVQGQRISNMSYGGYIPFGPPFPFGYSHYNFSQNGVLTPFNKATDGAIPTITSLKAKTKLDQFFVRFDYDVSDNVHAFANLTAANDYSVAGVMPNLEFFLNISGCNAFLTPAQQSTFGCDDPTNVQQQNDSKFPFNKVTDAALGGSNLNSTVTSIYQRNYSFMGGFEGKFAGDWHWNATYTFSQSKQDVRNDGIDLDRRWFAALDAVVNPATGKIVCNITLTNPGLQDNCVPINEFGPSAETPAALAYSFGRVERWTTNKMNGLAGSITGAPVNDWAGPVGLAVSAEYRQQSMFLTSNTPFTPIDCTGIRFNCNSDPTLGALTYDFGNNIQAMTDPAKQNIAEGAVEFDVPLIKDAPLAKSVTFNPAARYTSYDNKGTGVSTSFAADTWKLGVVWNLNDQLALRWTRSRDIRAPNLWELFAPKTQTTFAPGANDSLLCDPNNPASNSPNCGDGSALDPVYAAQLAPQVTAGNPNLRPEVGLTTTLGLVWKPTSDFSLAVDGYFINLKDAITALNGQSPQIQAACYSGSATSLYCQTQVRGANGLITKWYNNTVNFGGIKTNGIDFEANYRTRVADRALSLRGLVTYKPHMIYTEEGLKTIDQAGATYCVDCGAGGLLLPSPVWRTEGFVSYDLFQDFTASLSERWRSHMTYQGDRTLVEVGGGVPADYTTNLSLAYTFHPTERAQLTAYLNVQNVFDKLAPPVGSTGVGGNFPGDFGSYALGDDVVGRYYVLGVRGRL
jgi:outer membrane receptor protein involved in Fe transport